jgi:hypothetical protein
VALAAIVGALPACWYPQSETVPVDEVAYRPDGSLVLFTVAGIYVYDGLLRTELNHIPLDALAFPPLNRANGGNAGGLGYSLSADGNTAAVSYFPYESAGNARAAVYRIPDGELLSTFEIVDPASSLRAQVLDLALSPDGRLLGALAVSGRSKMVMLEAATGAPLWSHDVSRYAISPVWSPDGTTVFAKEDPIVDGADRTLDALDAGTGTLKWQTILGASDLMGLAVVGDGALLATAAWVRDDARTDLNDYPPTYPFWSAADGTLARELPGVPGAWLYAGSPTGGTCFTCNATDTCAAGLRDETQSPSPKYVRVFQPDGTVLQILQTEGEGATASIAISPDGNFLTTAAEPWVNRGATVFSIADGSVVGARAFPTETF